MNTHSIDNTIDIRNEISWQYDNATKFTTLVGNLNDFFLLTTSDFWNGIVNNILNIDGNNSFGLDMLGSILGLKRQVLSGSPMSDNLYRKILKGRFYLVRSNYSVTDINEFLNIAFGNAVTLTDNYDMSLTFTLIDNTDEELRKLFLGSNRTAFNAVFPFPAGVHSNNPITRTNPIGLNDDLTNGQNAANFDNGSFAQ